MADPRPAPMMDPKATPFDTMRVFWGEFKGIAGARRSGHAPVTVGCGA